MARPVSRSRNTPIERECSLDNGSSLHGDVMAWQRCRRSPVAKARLDLIAAVQQIGADRMMEDIGRETRAGARSAIPEDGASSPRPGRSFSACRSVCRRLQASACRCRAPHGSPAPSYRRHDPASAVVGVPCATPLEELRRVRYRADVTGAALSDTRSGELLDHGWRCTETRRRVGPSSRLASTAASWAVICGARNDDRLLVARARREGDRETVGARPQRRSPGSVAANSST